MDVLKKRLMQGLGAAECRQDVHDAYNKHASGMDTTKQKETLHDSSWHHFSGRSCV